MQVLSRQSNEIHDVPLTQTAGGELFHQVGFK